MPARPGQRVEHPLHGPGVVRAVRTGNRARVEFDARPLLPLTVPLAELQPPGGAGGSVPPSPPAPPAAAPPAPADPEEVADLRQAIEALRLGVVPATHARDYTVARERELADFESLLETGEGLRIVWGDYGTGKSHLLDVYEHLALDRGYMASRITLDPRETPPSHPQRLFREIVRGLRCPGQPGGGLDPLFHLLIDSRDHRSGRRMSRVLSPALLAMAHPESPAASWVSDYLDGYPMDLDDGWRELRRIGWRGPRPLALSDYRTYGRMYVHLVGTIAAWGADAGFRGLAILFDEVEYIEMAPPESRRLAEEVLKHYAAATLPREKLGFDPDHLYRGGHEVHKELPLRYADDQRLVVAMALTPLPEARQIAGKILADHDEDLDLTRLVARDFAELVRRIGDLYARAYPADAVSEAAVARTAEFARERAVVGDANPREIVRRAVMELDAARLAAGEAGRRADAR